MQLIVKEKTIRCSASCFMFCCLNVLVYVIAIIGRNSLREIRYFKCFDISQCSRCNVLYFSAVRSRSTEAFYIDFLSVFFERGKLGLFRAVLAERKVPVGTCSMISPGVLFI